MIVREELCISTFFDLGGNTKKDIIKALKNN